MIRTDVTLGLGLWSCLVPLLAGLWLVVRGAQQRNPIALSSCAAAAAWLGCVALEFWPASQSDLGRAAQSLTYDPIGTTLALALATAGLALALGLPATERTARDRGWLLMSEGALLTLYLADRYLVSPKALEALAVLAATLPLVLTLRAGPLERVRAASAVGVALSSALLISIAWVAGLDRLLWLGAFIRLAAFPLYGWMLYLAARADLGLFCLFVVSQPGLYLISHGANASMAEQPMLVGALQLGALGSALCGALLGSFESDLRRQLGALGMIMGGILGASVLHAPQVALPALLGTWFALILGVAGLALVISALEARVHSSETRRIGHLGLDAPALGVLALTFSLAVAGLPGTLGFVAGELMIEDWLATRPASAALLALCLALTGINWVRAIARMLPSVATLRLPLDLIPRERCAALLLVAPLIGFGIAPGWILAAPAPGAERADLNFRDGCCVYMCCERGLESGSHEASNLDRQCPWCLGGFLPDRLLEFGASGRGGCQRGTAAWDGDLGSGGCGGGGMPLPAEATSAEPLSAESGRECAGSNSRVLWRGHDAARRGARRNERCPDARDSARTDPYLHGLRVGSLS